MKRIVQWYSITLGVVLLLAGAAPSTAANYLFTGQVFQVTPDDAADESIADGDLEGDTRPYPTVKLYDAETDVFLGEALADADGIFTVQYDQPAGATPDVRVRVFQEFANATDVELPPAREAINEHENVGAFFGTGVWVTPDDILTYSTTGSGGDPGVGVVFTRVGKVEIPFIEQNPAAGADAGLADFSSNPARAAEMHVAAFRDAPFSGGLLVFGAFGLPGGPCAGNDIDYYRVLISKWNGAAWGAPQVWDQDMSKTRTTVTVSPTVTVHHDLVPVGPFAGTLSGGGSVDDLYWVNEDTAGFPTSVFYSFPDLRVNWNTRNWSKGPDAGLANGLYRLTMEYYRYVAGPSDSPTVELLPAGCFAGVPAGGSAGLHELVLRVNNQSLDVHFDHIYLRNPGGNYFPDSGTTPVSDVADALDFNGAGLCEILTLTPNFGVEIHFTAHHPGDYMRFYNLRATPNTGAQVGFVSESYPSAAVSPPAWEGTPAGGATATAPHGDWARCNYIFTLSAGSRLQNGYHYLQWAHPQRAFFVDP